MNSRAKFFVVFASTSLVVLLLIGAKMGASATAPEGPYKHLAVFTDVLSRIKSEYVEEPNMKSVTVGAVTGLLESIDPFASYLNAEQYKDYLKKRDGYKGDIGLILSKRAGFIGVVGVIPGSPADQSGIEVGDWLEAIKGVSTRDMPLAYAEILLKGEPASTIDISVFRSRRPEPQKMTLTRTEVKPPALTTEMLAEQTGLIRVTTMEHGKVDEVKAAVKKLEAAGAKRLLLDLRNCSLGSAEDGWALANLFVDKGNLGYTVGQKVPRKNTDADPAMQVTKLPLRVITNRGTAGAAEVAAGALLDSKRADVVGEKTYQAASVLRTIPLDDGSAVILSVAKYYTPSGKSIPEAGITPSVPLPEPEAQIDFDENGQPLVQETEPDAAAANARDKAYLQKVLEGWK
jgi:carboxyl-terminal processing protease